MRKLAIIAAFFALGAPFVSCMPMHRHGGHHGPGGGCPCCCREGAPPCEKRPCGATAPAAGAESGKPPCPMQKAPADNR